MARTAALLVVALALALAGAAAATSGVAAKQQLRGHLPELGASASLRVFLTAAEYDAFRSSSGLGGVFPHSSALFMSWEREILALYARGTDQGGRCLRADGAALGRPPETDVMLNLAWEAGTCGAPASARHPFVLVSLARVAEDATVTWIVPGSRVCATAPGTTATACGAAGPPAPSPTATPARTATPSPSPSPSPVRSPSPSPSPSPTPSPTATPSPPATPTPSTPPPPATRVTPLPAGATPAATPLPPPDGGPDVLVLGAFGAFVVLLALALVLTMGARR